MKIDIEDRIEYYLGNTKYSKELPEGNGSTVNSPFIYKGQCDLYQEDVERLSSRTNKQLWFQCGDKRYVGPNFPIITKTRDTHNPESKGIIGSLEYYRHFGMMPHVLQVDMPWEAKESKMVWRGATTGINKDDRKCSRLDFVRQYSDSYDVGFASIAGNWAKNNLETCNLYYKGGMSTAQMSRYKYLPVLDGNDKASALNWILLSNSVPIMPKPRFHSWLCEKFLLPNIHYVELKDDYSDLPERLDWCMSHDSECKHIAANGTDFIMSNFNRESEIEAEKLLVENVDKLYNNL